MRLVLPLAALVWIACGRVEERAVAGEHAEAVSRSGAPHGGNISVIAVAEHGDMALTLDTLGELRLWPALDGSREPVPVAATASRTLALARAGDGVVAGIVDDAGVASVLSIAIDGKVRHRAQLPADVPVEQMIAIDAGMLVLRGDQSIDRYDANGIRRARLLAPEGEQIALLAARSGAAIAALKGDDGKITMLRRIAIDRDLRWGDAIRLPESILPSTLALSPSHQRVAAVAAQGVVAEVITIPEHGAANAQRTAISGGGVGFADDDHLAIVSSAGVQWWIGAKKDPWAANDPEPTTPPNPTDQANMIAFAVADHLVVTGFGSALALALANENRTRYLGWADLASGAETIAGSTIGYGPIGGHYTWLDDQLAQQRRIDLEQPGAGSVQQVLAVSDRVAVVERYVKEYDVALVDADHPGKQILFASYPSVQRLDYAPESHVLSITTQDKIERFSIDVDHLAVRALAGATGAQGVWFVRTLAPARARGDVLITLAYDTGGVRVVRYREPAKGNQLVAHSMTLKTPSALAIDASGVVYTLETADGHSVVVGHDGDREVTRFTPPEPPQLLAISPEGASFAMLSGHEVVVTDAHGVERWRYTAWSTSSVAFTGDGRRVLVRTSGGLILLDAATGQLATRACGWGFGLHDKPVQPDALGAPPVCED